MLELSEAELGLETMGLLMGKLMKNTQNLTIQPDDDDDDDDGGDSEDDVEYYYDDDGGDDGYDDDDDYHDDDDNDVIHGSRRYKKRGVRCQGKVVDRAEAPP